MSKPNLLTDDFLLRKDIISQKKIFQHLYGNDKKSRVKPGLTPDAQNTIQYSHRNDWVKIQNQVEAVQQRLFNSHRKLYYLIEIMMSGGLRVTEALSIRPYDITMTGLVKIRSLKKGNEKIISPGNAKEYLLTCKRKSIYPFDGFDRFYIYREFKKIGMPTIPTGFGKNAVTHIFRHLQVASLKEISEDKTVIKRYLGHKSIKSQENYGK